MAGSSSPLSFNIPISAPITQNPSSAIGGNISFGGISVGGDPSSNPFSTTSISHLVFYAGLSVLAVAVIHKFMRRK